ncbi:MAG: DNA recombination protein RmuC [Cyclobacteriaceae bacterium]|nr:DNA recombination protein RmuC [Cyclobacteriaceae bacterium SS2]
MESEMIIMLGIGAVLGIIIGYLLGKLNSKNGGNDQKARLELQMEREKAHKREQDLVSLNEQLKEERQGVIRLNQENASLQANYKNLRERLDEQRQEMMKVQEKFTAEFKNLANEIFEEKSKKFTDQNKTNLDELLKPLGDKLLQFEKKVEQTNKDSMISTAELKVQLEGLKTLNQRMSQEAENLTKALKGDAQARGNWGEIVLERILERSGLEKDREYFMQESYSSEEGRRLRPDVIIKLPDEKNLIIDSKVSLVSYEKYVNAEKEDEKEQALKAYLVSVKTHIKGLSEKNYHELFETGSLDYVLMFVPIESAFAMIVQQGGELYNEAHNKNIIIVSPSTLIATLRTVASIWKHEYQNRNALEIARQGGALYDKFKAFVDDLIEVGKSLDKSKHQYGMAMNKLVEGKDNLIRKTERLKELGAKTSKEMDQKILDRADSKSDDISVSQPTGLFG